MIKFKIENYNSLLTEAAKVSVLSSGKIDTYEYLTCEEVLPSDQIRINSTR